MKEKLVAVKSIFDEYFKERSEEINCAFLAIMAGEHILYLGPPGTAKSLLSKCICESIEGGRFYYYLLTRFTTPEEIFGPLSLKSLQDDEFKRKTDGYLPTANVAFLDEIFKSNSSILNSLLTILNERNFHNGQEVMTVPLLSTFGASNELPEAEEGLHALYDRFLFRCMVDYIQDDANFIGLVFGPRKDFKTAKKLSIKDITEIRQNAISVTTNEDIVRIIVELRKELRQKDILISDRRWKKVVDVLKIAAASLDKKEVDRTMVILLKHMLWDDPDQREPIRNLLLDMSISGGVDLTKLENDANDLLSLVVGYKNTQLPKSIQCVECNQSFTVFRQLEEHNLKNPKHNYYDPYENSYYNNRKRMSFNEILEQIKSKGITINSIYSNDKHRELCNREYSDLQKQFIIAKKKIDNERDTLKTDLKNNIWISEADKQELLVRYEKKLKQLLDIETPLNQIEEALKAVK